MKFTVEITEDDRKQIMEAVTGFFTKVFLTEKSEKTADGNVVHAGTVLPDKGETDNH